MKRQPNPEYEAARIECRFIDAEGRPLQLRHYPLRWKNNADADLDFARMARGERPIHDVKPLIRTKAKA